ncbi:hypothetical protein BC938DRAFT_481002 [Jimgerdemannia flammicorona]|uniref:Uncharacterized protein n=1 Tax=Jimgerdemannia flammicorona TaxID=994334 RepID=A0A433QX31_9FUNG|nr:hypothetical protein BC938DRAFT_481002 [Jimgerdemannia flammicorona]
MQGVNPWLHLNTGQRGNLGVGDILVEDKVVILDEHVAEDGEVEGAVPESSDASAVAVVVEDEVRIGDFETPGTDGEGDV